MKLISMLLALLIVGYLVLQQMNKPAATDAVVDPSAQTEAAPPKVPTRPQDVQQFKQDINTFVEDSKTRLDEQMEQAE